jgi:hypothetical protein
MPRSNEGILIQVTQEMIDEAIRRNTGNCMVTDAIYNAIPWAARVQTDTQIKLFVFQTRVKTKENSP